MSLVNDALRKARLEAARQEAARSGAILPTLGQVRRENEPRASSPRIVILAFLAAAALAIAAFTFSRLAVDGSEPDRLTPAESQLPALTDPSAMATEEAAATTALDLPDSVVPPAESTARPVPANSTETEASAQPQGRTSPDGETRAVAGATVEEPRLREPARQRIDEPTDGSGPRGSAG